MLVSDGRTASNSEAPPHTAQMRSAPASLPLGPRGRPTVPCRVMSDPPVIDLTVERPAVGGRMIARHAGRVVLVSGAVPGERVRAVIERSRRDVTFAQTVEVLEGSPDRRSVAVSPSCGGRSFAHIAYPRQVRLKSEIVRDAFRRVGRIDLADAPRVIASPEETGYRLRARLHVGDARLGFLDEGSHRVCDVTGTGQLLPKTERLVGALASHASALASHGVKMVELAEDLAGTQCVLHAVVQGVPDGADAVLRRLASVAGVTGVSVASDTVPAPLRGLAGTPSLTDRLAAFLPSPGARTLVLRRTARAFFQANRYLVPGLVVAVAALADGDELVDLYAGVGLFAVSIAAMRGGPVTAVERDASSTPDLLCNAAPLNPALRVVRAPVETFLKRCGGLERAAVIVDPPRTGLSNEVVTRLIRRRPRRIVYVSCDVATQARDLRALGVSGYGIDQVHVFDMFPNTPHIETVVSLDRE